MIPYTRQQEMVNGLIHGVGVLFALSALPMLTALAVMHENIRGVVGASVYSFCFLLLFTCSTIYHFAWNPAVKRVFEILDHISIYFMIAGTYTPFLLVYMNNKFGVTLLWVLWGLTCAGILFKILAAGKFEIISTLIYLLMGWTIVLGGKALFEQIPLNILSLIAIGGGLYTVGVVFYIWDKHYYTHAVWHFIVLVAAICHYVAVLLTMYF